MHDNSKHGETDKSKLLELLLRRKGIEAPPKEEIRHQHHSGPFALSFGQEKLWFTDRPAPDSPFYNTPAVFRMSGHLDVAALQRSFDELISRHEILRTRFLVAEGRLMQEVLQSVKLPLNYHDLNSLPEPAQEQEAIAIASKLALIPFDLKHAPLMRLSLLRLRADHHLLVIVIHHIISDGWSLNVLIRELVAAYEAFSSEKPLALPELPVQFSDYALWQHSFVEQESHRIQMQYWKNQLSGKPPLLDLPSDRPRHREQSFNGATLPIFLPPSFTKSVKAFNRKHGVTLFMTLLAAFKVLLCRYTNETDIVVGSPFAARNRAEVEPLIGCFSNTLALRTDLSGNPTFLETLERVRQVAIGAQAHQDIPFEKVLEELQIERGVKQSPFFQTMLVLQTTLTPLLHLGALTIDHIQIDLGIARYDLTVYLREEGEAIEGWIEYNTDLFDRERIERMRGNYESLLKAAIEDPQQTILDLPLRNEADSEQLLLTRQKTEVNCGDDPQILSKTEGKPD